MNETRMKKILSSRPALIAQRCMLFLLLAATVSGHAAERGVMEMRDQVIMDFTAGGDRGEWRVINDGVMGGLSRSEFLDEGAGPGVFRGSVSLENNGGFASVRTVPADLGLDGLDGLLLRVRGDGKRYSFRLRTDDRFDGVAWSSSFDTSDGEWVTVVLPFDGFRPTWRGRLVANTPPLNPADIRQLGLLIADKQSGPFRIEIDRISGYTGEGRERR